LQVARVKAQQTKAEADARAYAIIAQAKADAESVEITAKAKAAATRLAAQADADATRIKSEAGASVRDEFAREMELRRIEVQRVAAYGNRTVFVGEGAVTASANAAQGLALYKGFVEGRSS
jgi:regulator of protease activity HflC (stomatin/prohibitin superfamily)